MSRRYALLDVFASQALQGNPLAVVLEAEGLDGARMQAIAAEFNLAETVFVLPPANAAHRARLRIFSPTKELPFAGHPTVGSAVLLAQEQLGHVDAEIDLMMMLEEQIGTIRCAVSLKGGARGHAIFDIPVQAAPLSLSLDPEAVAAALGLMPSELGCENHVLSAFSSGLPYIFIPVRDLEAIGRVKPRSHLWEKAFGTASAYVYTRSTEVQDHHFHARMFWSGLGIVEDPATGSAAAAFAGVVTEFDQLPSGTHRFFIEQGFEMGRPSLISLEVDIERGALHASRIGGDAVLVGQGTIDV